MSAQTRRDLSTDPVSDEARTVAGHEVGGTVGDIHRMLEERLVSAPQPTTAARPLDEKLIQLFSRGIGYALLAGGFVACVWFLL